MLMTLPIAAAFMPFDGVMGVTTGALRGAGDAWVPMIAQALAFWLIAIPIAYFLGLHGTLGLPGLLIGILAGILASVAIMLPRFAIIAARARAVA
jgi:multidrug resistance protein, MATE family